MGRVAPVGEKRSGYRIVVGNTKGRDHLENLYLVESTLLKEFRDRMEVGVAQSV